MKQPRVWMTGLLAISSFFLYAEQNLLGPNLSAVADEFGFTDHERDSKLGGEISLGFFIVGGICGLFFGWLTDSSHINIPRARLFSMVIVLGEVGCLGTYISRSYLELFAYRVLTGIAIGGASPVIYSILGDLWDQSQRVRVSTIMGLSMSSGAAMGQILAGYLGPAFGWRFPFLIVAVPALLCAGILSIQSEIGTNPSKDPDEDQGLKRQKSTGSLGGVRSTSPIVSSKGTALKDLHENAHTRERDREISDSSDSEPLINTPNRRSLMRREGNIIPGEGFAGKNQFRQYMEKLVLSTDVDFSEVSDKVNEVFAVKTALFIFCQGIFGCIPWSIIGIYLNDYLSNDLNMHIHRSTLVMVLFGVGAIVGQVAGGWTGQALFNRDPRLQCIMMGVTSILGSVPMITIVNYRQRDTHGFLFYFFFFCGGILAAVTGPNIRSILQNVIKPENRGIGFALYTLFDDVGKGGGPFFVAKLVVMFNSRKLAFNFGMLGWVVGGLVCIAMTQTIVRDCAALQKLDSKHEKGLANSRKLAV